MLVDRFEGKRLNRPNDVVCRSDGSLYFTDPGLRVPLAERELTYAGVYRLSPDGATTLIADCEYPNGLAFSPDERILYVANTRWTAYIHAIELDADGRPDPAPHLRGHVLRRAGRRARRPQGRRRRAGLLHGPRRHLGICPDGTRLEIIRTPEIPANLAFGGPDLRTLFFTARTSVYTLRVKVPGQPHPWYRA